MCSHDAVGGLHLHPVGPLARLYRLQTLVEQRRRALPLEFNPRGPHPASKITRPAGPSRERDLQRYPLEIHRRLGRYYRLGNLWADLQTKPAFTSFLSRRIVTSPAAMRYLTRLLVNVTDDGNGRDTPDRVVNALVRAVPAQVPRKRR